MTRIVRTTTILFVLLGWAGWIASAADGAEDSETKPINPVWVTVIQHIEEGAPVDEDRELYLRQRQAVVELANKIKELGFTYNFQSDWRFLVAIKKHDDEQVMKSTNGKNLVRWLKEDLGFEVDPHAHESKYNYADVAYLIEQLDIKTSAVAGGFVYMPLDRKGGQPWWDLMRKPLKGWNYPDYEWQAEILWGAATAGHRGKDELYASGIWRPKSREEYTVNDPNGNLIHVGNYQGNAPGLIDLVDRLERGEVQPADGMWTATVQARHSDLRPGSERMKLLIENLELLVPYTQQGKIRWAGLTEMVEIWKTKYGANSTFFRSPVRPSLQRGRTPRGK